MTFEVRVAGQRLTNFARGDIRLTMDEAAGFFDLEYIAGGKHPGERALFPGDPIELLIDDELVLSGYVETTEEDDTPDDLRLRAVGRSKTGDLIDCSAIHRGFANAKASAIAQALAKPFGIKVYTEGDEGAPFPSFSVQSGETVIDVIERATRKRGLYPYAVGADLVLGRAGAKRTDTLLERGNVLLLRSNRSDSWNSRYSEYVFRGQIPATDSAWGSSAAHLKHSVSDPAITRYRPLRVHAWAHAKNDLQTRAQVERNQRAARGERLTVTLDGWHTNEGYTWRPNLLVPYRNSVLGVDATLLIAVVRFRVGENEPPTTELELTRPEAYETDEYPVIGRGETWR